MTDINKFTYRVMWSEEDQEFIALCTEFPSLSWLDENSTLALEGIQNLVNDCVADRQQNNETIPEPYSMRSFSGKFQVRIPPELHRNLAIEAAESGVSLNRVVSAKLAAG